MSGGQRWQLGAGGSCCRGLSRDGVGGLRGVWKWDPWMGQWAAPRLCPFQAAPGNLMFSAKLFWGCSADGAEGGWGGACLFQAGLRVIFLGTSSGDRAVWIRSPW